LALKNAVFFGRTVSKTTWAFFGETRKTVPSVPSHSERGLDLSLRRKWVKNERLKLTRGSLKRNYVVVSEVHRFWNSRPVFGRVCIANSREMDD
jgi:hypothetical protein